MKQILEDIRSKLNERKYRNEEHVRLSLVARILSELGWNIWNPAEVNTEFTATPNEDNTRVDFALFVISAFPSVYIEVKPVGKIEGDISQIEIQLRDYNRNNTATFTVLTDGRRWRFYYSQTGGQFSQKCFRVLDLIDDELEEITTSFQTFLSKQEIQNESAKHAAESYLQLTQKQRAMEDVVSQARKIALEAPFPPLPEALVELVAQRGLNVTHEEAVLFLEKSSSLKPTPTPPPTRETKKLLSHKTPYQQPVTTFGVSEAPTRLETVLDVCYEIFHSHLNYNEAVKLIASRRRLSSVHTVYDHCTRGIELNTEEFKELLNDKARLIDYLAKRFPQHRDYIIARIN